VAGGTPLAAVAEASGATLAQILDLNGQFLRGATPPGEPSLVRLPVGAGEGFAARLAALPEERRVGFTRVTTKDNGRLSRIAADHGTTEARLAAFNPGLRRNRRGLLVGGQRVLVPSRLVLGAARDVPDPSIERYGPAAARTRAAAAKPKTYRVKPGDALERIARAHDLSVTELRRMNGLKSSLIRPGQLLVVGSRSR
jgi:LysM repeat protein